MLVAPTSTGRNTIIRHLLKNPDYYFVVSDTTRPPQVRDGQPEQNGVDYFFRSEGEILADLKTGEFLEAAIIHEQQVSGISIRELEKAKGQGKIAITDIEIVGVDNVMRANPEAKAIFLLPPSFEEWQKRMHSRSHMGHQELDNRLKSAEKELKAALEHDYYHFVIAEDIGQAAGIIDSIANNGPNPHQDRGLALVKSLYAQLQHKPSN